MNITVKTVTIVNAKERIFQTICFSDLNELATTKPDLFRSNLLDKELIINNIKGIEGEVILNGAENSSIQSDGDLKISLENDKAENYSLLGQDIKYEIQ